MPLTGNLVEFLEAAVEQPPHLPGSLTAINAPPDSPHFRVALLGDRGISASVGTSSLNRIAATSRLLLPAAAGKLS